MQRRWKWHSDRKVRKKPLTRLRKWSFPPYKKKKQLPAGRIKLKTDGCAKGSPGPPGIGGIARDDQGGYFIWHMAKKSIQFSC